MPWRGGKGGPGWEGHFRGCGYRWTVSREVIIEVLSSTRHHMSAEDIYHAVHKDYPAIGLTTVYRTLDLLVDMGLVLKFDFGDKRARYELAEEFSTKEHHHHLVCNRCGRVIDYTEFIDDEVELFKKTEKGLSKKYGFQIKSRMIQFSGLCGNCNREQK
ncbi:MAG: transcriptional repressor [Candidatus Aureabacteria bacterium]|nr:transcriptional repressor [Candidatus Auribacterota bacterium]